MELIDKAAVIAEINRQHKILMQTEHTYGAQFVLGFRQACRQIIDFLDTLEAKEVDLENKKCKDLNDDGTCIFATNKIEKAMRCAYINCSRKVQKGE